MTQNMTFISNIIFQVNSYDDLVGQQGFMTFLYKWIFVVSDVQLDPLSEQLGQIVNAAVVSKLQVSFV